MTLNYIRMAKDVQCFWHVECWNCRLSQTYLLTYLLSTHCLVSVSLLSSLSNHCLPVVYTLSTHCLPVVYALSTHCLPIVNPLHRGAICQFLFQWIYYCHSSKSTGKKTGITHLCALHCNVWSMQAISIGGHSIATLDIILTFFDHRPTSKGEFFTL